MKKIVPVLLGVWACIASSHAAFSRDNGQAGLASGVAPVMSADSGKGLTPGHPAGCGCPACVQARMDLMNRVGGQT